MLYANGGGEACSYSRKLLDCTINLPRTTWICSWRDSWKAPLKDRARYSRRSCWTSSVAFEMAIDSGSKIVSTGQNRIFGTVNHSHFPLLTIPVYCRLFNDSEIETIKNWKLAHIISTVTNIDRQELPTDVFRYEPNQKCPQPFQINASSLTPCRRAETYNFFEGSEFAFVFSFLGLAAVPLSN